MTEHQTENNEQHFDDLPVEQEEEQQDSQDRISEDDDENEYQDSVEEPVCRAGLFTCKCNDRVMEMLIGIMTFQAVILGMLVLA
jgi:hypothetical protein